MTPAASFDLMVGECPEMLSLFATIEKVAPTDLTVLVQGETGTGKELVARSLHARSPRARAPFVALNCAAIPTTLLESELFGYVHGAFTGAGHDRKGTIELAHRGTLFLDEIAEMQTGAQAKLLRVLQERCVRPLGSMQERKIDVRVVAATHQDVATLAGTKAFRRDLYHRLNEMTLVLPPLRERNGDIELIASHILARLGRESGRSLQLSEAARAILLEYPWPGNVRELENALLRAAACCKGAQIEVEDLRLRGGLAPLRLSEILDQATEGAVREALRRHRGDAVAAARELDLPPATLRQFASRFHIDLDGA